jgi:hypothetical protein
MFCVYLLFVKNANDLYRRFNLIRSLKTFPNPSVDLSRQHGISQPAFYV